MTRAGTLSSVPRGCWGKGQKPDTLELPGQAVLFFLLHSSLVHTHIHHRRGAGRTKARPPSRLTPTACEKAVCTWWTPNPLGNYTFSWAGGVPGAFPLWSIRAQASFTASRSEKDHRVDSTMQVHSRCSACLRTGDTDTFVNQGQPQVSSKRM